MFMPASSEFVTLCRSQMELLTQGLGAALSVVYLTEELVEGATSGLVPIVVYPDTGAARERERALLRLNEQADALFDPIPRLLQSASSVVSSVSPDSTQAQTDSNRGSWEEEKSLRRQRQIVLPLMHDGVVMGLLVTGREDRSWEEEERVQIERIAKTLAIACIMDRRRAWFEQQLEAKQRLQAQQRDLLDNLLHQFRNPMTAIRTFGKLLIRRLRPGDANREVANSIVRETDRLQELLQQFDKAIDLAETEKVPLILTSANPETASNAPFVPLLPDANWLSLTSNTQFCSLAEVLKPLLDSANAIAQERNLNLIAEIPHNLPFVKADPKALQEVLNNLIDNALKYTPAGGRVFIQAGQIRHSPQGNFQAIAISDTGPGIPPQDLEHIFERHYRGVQAQTAIPGTGLGLAIAQNLVEQMQGQIEVISPAAFNWAVPHSSQQLQTSGTGTTFIIWLPTKLANE